MLACELQANIEVLTICGIGSIKSLGHAHILSTLSREHETNLLLLSHLADCRSTLAAQASDRITEGFSCYCTLPLECGTFML